jgi:hypothetical protein
MSLFFLPGGEREDKVKNDYIAPRPAKSLFEPFCRLSTMVILKPGGENG